MNTKVIELENLKQYLKDNAGQIASSFEFEKEQADIFAFELEGLYSLTTQNQKVYRLDVARSIKEML